MDVAMDTIGSGERLRDDLEAQQRPRAQQLTEEADDSQHDGVAEAVTDPIEEGLPGTIAKGEGLQTTHEDTVGDDQPDEDGELLAHVVGVGL